jgi:hypothetical protein
MMVTTQRRTVMISLCAVALLAVSGCGGGGTTSSASSPATTAASQTYSSKAFVVPLTVTVDAALKSPPHRDSPHLLSWDAAVSDPDNAVRFFAPVIVFPAGSHTPQAPPKDYLKYLQSQAKYGAEFSKVTKITVDGHPATLMNVTTSRPEGYLSATIGCFVRTAANRHEDGCFGPQPDLLLRMAVIDLGQSTLLTWARVHKDNPDPAFVAMFEHMLTTVRFR